MTDLNSILRQQQTMWDAAAQSFWWIGVFYVTAFLCVALLALSVAWFFFRHLPRMTNAIALYFERKAGGGTTGMSPVAPTAPAPSSEELRARAYKSVEEIERRYGQKKS